MTDIIVFALPADRASAELILDGLVDTKVAGPYSTEMIVEHPESSVGWRRASSQILGSKCTVFCWSAKTSYPDAAPMIELAQRAFSQDQAISVECDLGSRPAALEGCSTYPLHGWRATPRPWHRFVFGNRFVTQIASAAQQKVLGRDPAPPSAYAAMVRAQAWVAMVGLAAMLSLSTSVLTIYRDTGVARWLDPQTATAFEAALASPEPCEALRAFGEEHAGSAWSSEASDILNTCTTRDVIIIVPSEQRLEVFGATAAEAEEDATRKCMTYAGNTGATVTSVRIEDFVANVRATAVCSLDQPVTETVETMGNRGR